VGIVPVGTAEGTGISPQDRTHDPPVRSLQDVGTVHLLRRAVISAEDADFWLLFVPGSWLAHLPLHAKQIEPREATAAAAEALHLPLGQRTDAELVLERAQDREALLQVEDGGGRGAPGRTAAVQRSALAAATRDYARTLRGIVQAQGRLQGLGDGVGVLGHAELVVFRDQRRQTQIVVPEIESVVIWAARVQIVMIEKIHGGHF